MADLTGLEALPSALGDIQRTFDGIGGALASVSFDPSNPIAVENAIRLVEQIVDDRAQAYPANSYVGCVRDALKRIYTDQIREAARASEAVSTVANLTSDDERVLVIACEQLLRTTSTVVSLEAVRRTAIDRGMTLAAVRTSIASLEGKACFCDVLHGLQQPDPAAAVIGAFAFEYFLMRYRRKDYVLEKIRIVTAIAKRGAFGSRSIARDLHIHEYVVDHVLEGLEDAGHVFATHSSAGTHVVPKPSVSAVLDELRRNA